MSTLAWISEIRCGCRMDFAARLLKREIRFLHKIRSDLRWRRYECAWYSIVRNTNVSIRNTFCFVKRTFHTTLLNYYSMRVFFLSLLASFISIVVRLLPFGLFSIKIGLTAVANLLRVFSIISLTAFDSLILQRHPKRCWDVSKWHFTTTEINFLVTDRRKKN